MDVCEGNDSEEHREKTKTTSPFEMILKQIGNEGRFQKLLLYCFIIPVAICNSLGANNTTLLLTTPNHRCHVPGRPANLSIEEWSNVTIPWEIDSFGEKKQSSCFMYDISEDWKWNHFNETDEKRQFDTTDYSKPVIKCKYGWDFGHSEWRETPVSQFEWVCEKQHIVTTLFSLTFAGNTLGTVLLSLIADRYGRKTSFYLTLTSSILCSTASIFTQNTVIYCLLRFFLAGSYYSLIQLPYVIATEISGEKIRTIMSVSIFTASVTSACLLPGFVFLFGHWKIFTLVCHLPVVIFYTCWRILPESPRWLLHRSKLVECELTLRRISRCNHRTFTDETHLLLMEAEKQESRNGTFKEIFRCKILRKHFILSSLLLGIGTSLLSSMMLNIHYIKGDKLINFIIFALAGVPGNILGGLSAKYFGRRCSTVVTSVLSAFFCFLATYMFDNRWAITGICATIKMLGGTLFLIVYMQVAELFPTSLRSTAYGFSSIVICAFNIFIPSIVALGRIKAFQPYYILMGICLLGVILSSFLPETVGKPIPQTISEAVKIGQNQPYLSFIHKWNAHKYLPTDETQVERTEAGKFA